MQPVQSGAERCGVCGRTEVEAQAARSEMPKAKRLATSDQIQKPSIPLVVSGESDRDSSNGAFIVLIVCGVLGLVLLILLVNAIS